MIAEIGRWLVALGVVAASVGFTVLGMSMAYTETVVWQKDVSEGLMAGGGLAIVVGVAILYAAGEWRSRPVQEPQSAQTQIKPR